MTNNGEFATRADLAQLKEELVTAMQAQEARFKEQLSTAIEGQDARFKEQLNTAIEAQDQRFQGRMDVMEQRLADRIIEAVRDGETKLLQAFYAYAESDDKRHRTTEVTVGGVVDRLASVETRLLAVEKHLNLPPAA